MWVVHVVSGIVFSTAGVLWMSVVRGVGEVCEMCMCLARGGVGGEGVSVLGFTNYVRTGGVLDVCLCLGCGGVGCVGVEWVGGLVQGLEVWAGVMSVYMTGPGICVLCLADTCASEVHPVFNHVAPYGYLLPNMYLFIADIANPDSFV